MAKKPRKGQRVKVPVTRHPLFPAIVALWFAALFGLGSLAIRPGLIESLVLATHLDLLIPAAAPPLGVTARIFLALTLAIGGGILGATIARRIARPKVEARPLRRSSSFTNGALRAQEAQEAGLARRPISAHEEIGESAIAGGEGVTLGGRRRALAIEEEEDEFRMFETAPLPGGQPPVFDPHGARGFAEPENDSQELDLGSFEPLPSAAEPAFAAPQPEPELAARQMFEPVAVLQDTAEPLRASEFAPFAQPAAPPIDFSRPAEVAREATGFEPLDFSRPNPPVATAPFAVPQPEAAPAAIDAPAPAPEAPAPEPQITPTMGTDAVVAALDDLGLIELTERFAQTLRKRRQALGEVAAPEAPAVLADSGPTLASFAPQSSAGLDAPAPSTPLAAEPAEAPAVQLPAAMRPLDFDADDDEDEDLSSLLPLRKFAPLGAAPAAEPEEPAFATPVEAVEEAEVSDAVVETEGYSSLLDLVKQPAPAPQFVRIEEPDCAGDAIEPVVIFPGQAARQGLGPAPVQAPILAPFEQPAAPFAAPVAAFEAPPTAQVEAPASDGGGLRPFDSPAAARPGQPVAAAAPAPVQDPAETERALRAALATLQRMSGAA